MTNQGKCVWFELFSTDINKSKVFYSELFNWSAEDCATPDGSYTIFKTNGKSVAGLTQPKAAFLNNTWLAYIAVPSLDQAVAAIQAQGGKLLAPEVKMPQVGRWVYAQDAQGTLFAPFEAEAGATDCAVFGEPQSFCWHELMTTDYQVALQFYGKLFNWTKAEAIDMGPMGTYQIYGTGTAQLGGMMNITPEMNTSKPYWLEYVFVDNVDETVARAIRLGGKATFPAMDVASGAGRIGGLVDNVGAQIAVYTNLKKA